MKSIIMVSWAILIFSMNCLSQSRVEPFQADIVNGGRAMAMGVDPNDDKKLIVASASGGLFRSVDGGLMWNHCSGKTTFGFNDVLYINSNIILASAKADFKIEQGGGVWRSTDAGVNWTKVSISAAPSNCRTNFGAFSLSRSPSSNRIWAGTSCGLMFSDDQGAQWTFIKSSGNYNGDYIYSVLSPTARDIKILTNSGVKVSTDTGRTWTVSTSGMPSRIFGRFRNQIAVSPLDHKYIYWSINYWKEVAKDSLIKRNALYFSKDNGRSWNAIRDLEGSGRPTFVQTTPSLTGTANSYEIYYHNGSTLLERTNVSYSFLPIVHTPWTVLNISNDIGGHADLSSVVFHHDGISPYFLTGDGGLHLSVDNGKTWPLFGGGKKGYNAIQITEVKGQHRLNGLNDLYFATQDNSIWASRDNGMSWPESICCEGFHMQVPEFYLPDDKTSVTYRACYKCVNYISKPGLTNKDVFSNAPGNDGFSPCLIKPKTYLQIGKIETKDTLYYNYQLTSDNAVSWNTKFSFEEELRDLPKVAAGGTEPIIYMAVKLPGSTMNGEELLGIRKVVGLLRNEKPIVSDITGFGSLGTFPTEFAWYRLFGVYPFNPNILIVPDIIDDVVKTTRDGGMSWKVDTNLTKLVTQNGKLLFHNPVNGFTQISCFGFDPFYGGHWMVGTRQAGVFQTFDHGLNWEFVADSDQMPNISSFYFMGNSEIAVSTYGRGLWKLYVMNPDKKIIEPKKYIDLDLPLIYYKGAVVPLKDIRNPDVCPVCAFHLLENAKIAGIDISGANEINMISLLSGKIKAYDLIGRSINPSIPFQLENNTSIVLQDSSMEQFLIDQKLEIKGFYTENNKLSAYLLARRDIKLSDLPVKRTPVAHIALSATQKGASLSNPLNKIKITGFGFRPNLPIIFSINGKIIKPEGPPIFNRRGTFGCILPVVGNETELTVKVLQKNGTRNIMDLATFNTSISDEVK